MQHAEGANRQGMAQYTPEPAIRRVLHVAKPVAMHQLGLPRPDRAGPRAQGILRARFGHQCLSAPAIMIPTDPKNRNSGVVKVSERGQHPKPCARHGVSPRKPEIEKVAHDHQRTGARR